MLWVVRSGEDFEVVMGFLGFRALVRFVVTVILVVTSKPVLPPP